MVAILLDRMKEIDKRFVHEDTTQDGALLLSGQVMPEGAGAMKDW